MSKQIANVNPIRAMIEAMKGVTTASQPTYVVHGAEIECSCGLRKSNVVVLESHGTFIHGIAQLRVGDNKPNENILSFGGCTNPENPSVQKAAENIVNEVKNRERSFMDRVMDFFCKKPEGEVNQDFVGTCAGECIPVIDMLWIDGKKDTFIVDSFEDEKEDYKALLSTCTLTCAYGGNITITDNGQDQTTDAVASQTQGDLIESFEGMNKEGLSLVSGGHYSEREKWTKWYLENTPPHADILSKEHLKIINAANKIQVDDVDQWTNWEFIKWQMKGDKCLENFENQWIKGYRDVIKAAAEEYNLPAYLVAGTAKVELGGDPLWADDFAYDIRKLNPNGGKKADYTSFGNISIQVRRASESLEYDNPTEKQKRNLIYSLKNPKQNIFIAAKHLSDLRDIDFKGLGPDELTEEDVKVIGERYHKGPQLSIDECKKNVWYGEMIINNKSLLERLLNE